jgi:S1-C subfamily serine protease
MEQAKPTPPDAGVPEDEVVDAGGGDAGALDAYSRVVTRVAELLTPSVASLRIRRRSGRVGVAEGAGSGVVIDGDGFGLTSAHVVGPVTRGVAALVDGRELDFEVVGRDALSDLAVIRFPADGLRPAELGDASELRVGQLVVAIGNPMGFGGSVTAGVVSALGRALPVGSRRTVRIVENVIQTDAALNPGNSGGALADGRARVVGINTAVAGVGLGLAIPIDEATRRIVSALISEGRFRRAYLGIAGGTRPLPPRVAQQVSRAAGLEVIQVVDGSPAAAAGIRPEDLIVDVEGVPIEDVGDLQRLMVSERIGGRLEIRLFRDGRLQAVGVVPVELVE